ncbi:MAG: hypothetical protein Q7R55_01410 [Candidatus Wildermuthbacteria bacterium]|nr:hypothetical protein [Candidatus Wildermuthbacteria bacterium]
MANPLIRKIYLYLFALVGLIMITVGSARLVGLGLRIYVFPDADRYYEYPVPRAVDLKEGETPQPDQKELAEFQKKQTHSQRQRELSESLAWIIVGLPLWLYHWSVIKREKE